MRRGLLERNGGDTKTARRARPGLRCSLLAGGLAGLTLWWVTCRWRCSSQILVLLLSSANPWQRYEAQGGKRPAAGQEYDRSLGIIALDPVVHDAWWCRPAALSLSHTGGYERARQQ